MKIIHISDIHLTENGREIWGVNTLDHFSKAIWRIKNIDGIDGIFVSGDLSDDGSRWTYEFIDRAFSEIGIPTFCCPGNHDNLDEFYNGYKPSFYSICDIVKLCGWNFIMLNSAVRNMSRGFICQEKLSNLIQRCKGKVAVILHHPPIEQEGWLNRKLLKNRDKFNDIIRHSENVRLVLYGHTHYYTKDIINGKVYCSAPSIGFAFNPNLNKFEIANGEEGFSIIEIDGDNVLITREHLYEIRMS